MNHASGPGNGSTSSGDTLRRTRWLRRLCIGVVLVAAAEFVIATTGVQIRHLPPSTDFATYYFAGAQAREGLSPYDRAALAARGYALAFPYTQFPFLYPPPFALAMQPFARIAYPAARQIWMVLCTLQLLAAIAFTWVLVRRQARWLGHADEALVWILLAAFVPAALNSTSVHNDIRAGQVGCLLFFLLALAAWALVPPAEAEAKHDDAPATAQPTQAPATARPSHALAIARPSYALARLDRKREVIAGVALGLASLVKVFPLALVVWAAWRGAWRTALVAVAAIALAMLAAVLHWGPSILSDWVQRGLLPILSDQPVPPMNQSLVAFLSRLMENNGWVEPWVVAPTLREVLTVLGGFAIGVPTLLALARPRPPAALLPVEMGVLLLAVLSLMKLMWIHTLSSMLWVWPALMVVILRTAERQAPWARRAGIAAVVGFFLSSAHVPILWAGLRQGPLVAITGVHLLGVLVLWATALVVLRHGPEVDPS